MPDATDSRLHFIKDQQNAVPIAQLAQTRQKSIGRHQIAALALNRFDQDRGDFACRHIADEQYVFNVIENRLALVVAGEQRPVRIRIGHVGHARACLIKSLSAACTYWR